MLWGDSLVMCDNFSWFFVYLFSLLPLIAILSLFFLPCPNPASHKPRGGFKGHGGRAHCEKSGPLCPPTARSKVNDADILLNYVVIANNVYM